MITRVPLGRKVRWISSYGIECGNVVAQYDDQLVVCGKSGILFTGNGDDFEDVEEDLLQEIRAYRRIDAMERARRHLESHGQFVYFFSCEQHQAIKIGWTCNPILRRKELQNFATGKLYCLGVIENCGREIEGYLHQLFDRFRIPGEGEWFQDVQEIREFASLYTCRPGYLNAHCYSWQLEDIYEPGLNVEATPVFAALDQLHGRQKKKCGEYATIDPRRPGRKRNH